MLSYNIMVKKIMYLNAHSNTKIQISDQLRSYTSSFTQWIMLNFELVNYN